MAKAYKVAGQSAPAANTDTTLYTVPANKNFVASSLVFCNRSNSVLSTLRVAIVPSGETLNNQHYISYEEILDIRERKSMVLGFALAAGDKVVVRSSTANLSFTLFGVENPTT
jgi:hypothetical protein